MPQKFSLFFMSVQINLLCDIIIFKVFQFVFQQFSLFPVWFLVSFNIWFIHNVCFY